jgi:hypothetical protein
VTICTDTAPGTGHGWLAKVLAGDPLACAVLNLARSLPEPDWDAFTQRCEVLAPSTANPVRLGA